MVSLKFWVGEEKWEPDYFKLGGGEIIKEYVLILMSNCKREDNCNENKLAGNIILNMVTYWQFVGINLDIRVFSLLLWEAKLEVSDCRLLK